MIVKPKKACTMPERYKRLLRRPRRAGTETEALSVQELLDALLNMQGIKFWQDEYGNVFALLGNAETMFSCHTDTVHRTDATHSELECADGFVQVKGGGVLGADCATGWEIMLQLLEAKVPGLYVWHREEEIGGLGSTYAVQDPATIEVLKDTKRCIAFDRAGYSSVITHQGGGIRCASYEFASALARELNKGIEQHSMLKFPAFSPDDTGIFTDSFQYRRLIPECTNISVGYLNEHTKREAQDLYFMQALIETLKGIDYSALPTARDCTAPETDHDTYAAEYALAEVDAMVTLMEDKPYEIADYLMSVGITVDDLYEVIYK